MSKEYDSSDDTKAHILRVQQLLYFAIGLISNRADVHDASKLEDPEKSIFDIATPKLKTLTYGSAEYKASIAEMQPALEHHYANNSHHPEHYGYLECDLCFTRVPLDHNEQCPTCRNGGFTTRPNVAGMTILDLLEMLCDWKAAGERHADGSMARSLEINRKRFEISDQLQSIFENSAKEFGWT